MSANHNEYLSQQGFTLLELMISMVIFSLMSVMAYSGLASMIDGSETTKEYDTDLKSLQRAMMFIERDFRQLVARPRRVDYSSLSAALTSGLDSEGLVEFTRTGNPNPANQLRSALQRVQYEFDENKIIRKNWNLVDHTVDTEPTVMPLLSNLEEVSLRFLDKTNTWQDNWGAEKQQSLLPKAVELTLEHERWGKIIRIIPVQ